MSALVLRGDRGVVEGTGSRSTSSGSKGASLVGSVSLVRRILGRKRVLPERFSLTKNKQTKKFVQSVERGS